MVNVRELFFLIISQHFLQNCLLIKSNNKFVRVMQTGRLIPTNIFIRH